VRSLGLHPIDIKMTVTADPPTAPFTPRSPQPPKSPMRPSTAAAAIAHSPLAAATTPSPPSEDRLAGAVHLLRTEANALQALAALYESNATCRDGFSRTIDAITRHRSSGGAGKVVFTGVGKSGWIAKKSVATFTSLGIPAVFLHPTEALHGDLGIVGDHDTIIMVTFSGKTPELMLLLPHLKPSCPLVCLTAPMTLDACALAKTRPDLVLLPAPIPEPETATFGVSAPTTSTTMAIAMGDALAFVASKEMYHHGVAGVFGKNHPGGAIGQTYKHAGR
jgi:D-arabinose 5-phosphate isomerase GutQ